MKAHVKVAGLVLVAVAAVLLATSDATACWGYPSYGGSYAQASAGAYGGYGGSAAFASASAGSYGYGGSYANASAAAFGGYGGSAAFAGASAFSW